MSIGSDELISKHAHHPVPMLPGGLLNDYVPFYFTPFSVMMKNIRSGRGLQQRPNSEIVILVSSLYRIQELGFLFCLPIVMPIINGLSFIIIWRILIK